MSYPPLSSLGPTSTVGDAATDYVLVPRRDLKCCGSSKDAKAIADQPAQSRKQLEVGVSDTPSSFKYSSGNLSKPSLTDPQGIGNSTDVKEEVSKPTSLVSISRTVLSSRSFGRKGALKPYRVDTAIRFGSSGSSATFYAPVIAQLPNSSSVTEAVQFATLFDEARCIGITAHARVDGTAAIGSGSWALVYDPGANSGAYTSVVGTMVSRQHIGPIAYNQTAATIQAATMTKTGYHSIKVRPMRTNPTAGASAVSEGVGNDWFSTSDVAANVGYFKFACDAVTGQAVTVDLIVVYHMEYRSRT
jgi:hypothetical protein